MFETYISRGGCTLPKRLYNENKLLRIKRFIFKILSGGKIARTCSLNNINNLKFNIIADLWQHNYNRH